MTYRAATSAWVAFERSQAVQAGLPMVAVRLVDSPDRTSDDIPVIDARKARRRLTRRRGPTWDQIAEDVVAQLTGRRTDGLPRALESMVEVAVSGSSAWRPSA